MYLLSVVLEFLLDYSQFSASVSVSVSIAFSMCSWTVSRCLSVLLCDPLCPHSSASICLLSTCPLLCLYPFSRSSLPSFLPNKPHVAWYIIQTQDEGILLLQPPNIPKTHQQEVKAIKVKSCQNRWDSRLLGRLQIVLSCSKVGLICRELALKHVPTFPRNG